MKRATRLSVASAALLGALCWGAANEDRPKHLADALRLVERLDVRNTRYRFGQASVQWEGICAVHADCSGFLNALLRHSYGYRRAQLRRWFGSGRPTAARYHDAIARRTGFTEVKRLRDALPGDILAVKYRHPSKSTGHVLLLAGPVRRLKARPPRRDGTEQWAVPVIDSALSGHGPTDSRHGKRKGGKDHDGLGRGILRVYTDKGGGIAGHAWSTSARSRFRPQRDRHLVIGRLLPAFKP
jgi:hypothetical protein